MPKYDRLNWSHGYNAENHPRNLGADHLAWYCWNGEPGDDLDCVSDDADVEENGGELIGWVSCDYLGQVFARFDGIETEIADGSPRTGFQWVEAQNAAGHPSGS